MKEWGGHNRKPLQWVHEGDCMICTSHRGGHGYPEMWRYGIRRKIARHVFLRRYGKQLSSVIGRHTCDRKNCINPDHIIPGTTRDNVNDCCERGRNTRGSRHGMSKLVESDIPKIRHLLSEGKTYQEIGNGFGVTRQLIYRIKHRKSWGHI